VNHLYTFFSAAAPTQ